MATAVVTRPSRVAEPSAARPGRGGGLRNTKIVCTAGPSTQSAETIRRLIVAGANVFRLNFSHADHAWHSAMLAAIRAQALDLGAAVAVMQDLCGPKIRVAKVNERPAAAQAGDVLRLAIDESALERGRCDFAITCGELDRHAVNGLVILINDGRIELRVEGRERDAVIVRVVRGGQIALGQGVNLPGASLSTEATTAKDWKDLQWGIENEVDFVALSFVRRPDDLVPVLARLTDAGSGAKLIAKIERPEAIEHIDQIVELADGVMVARGDLGLETEMARVPLIQKQVIRACRRAAKPVITATQMLDSMVRSPAPTRAEVSDVANAIFDGTDAVMVSNETATGLYPVEAVEVASRIAEVTESGRDHGASERLIHAGRIGTVHAVADAAAAAATTLSARRVVVYSTSGATARVMARYRLPIPVTAVTNVAQTYRQLSLIYGIHPEYLPHITNLTQLIDEVDQLAGRCGWACAGETIVMVSALDGRDGQIDTLHVHRIAE